LEHLPLDVRYLSGVSPPGKRFCGYILVTGQSSRRGGPAAVLCGPPGDELLQDEKEEQMTSTAIVVIAVGALMVGMVVVFVIKEALNCLFKTLLFLGALAIVGIVVAAVLAH
jgi:hypothetical protein